MRKELAKKECRKFIINGLNVELNVCAAEINDLFDKIGHMLAHFVAKNSQTQQ